MRQEELHQNRIAFDVGGSGQTNNMHLSSTTKKLHFQQLFWRQPLIARSYRMSHLGYLSVLKRMANFIHARTLPYEPKIASLSIPDGSCNIVSSTGYRS
ncbi:MAG: hypothetical protein ACLVEJ_21480 [Parabacteroides sp.]